MFYQRSIGRQGSCVDLMSVKTFPFLCSLLSYGLQRETEVISGVARIFFQWGQISNIFFYGFYEPICDFC
jgi:hypothetical protein